MRTMTHHGRGKGRGGRSFGSKHNDRSFDVTKAAHIDAELTPDNLYWCIYEGVSFEAAELRFYENTYAAQLEETNNKYRANGHPERCKTMDQWKKIRRYAPEESIYQIGDKHNTGLHVDADTLFACFNEFLAYEQKWNEEHGNLYTVLNYSLHVDEPGCPPHIHSRKSWHYCSEDGTMRTGQEHALELAGIEPPEPGQPIGRYNNRKITYDAMMREKWLDICVSHGIDIEREPLPNGKHKKSKDKEEYIRDKYANILNDIEAAEKELSFQTMMANSESARALREHKRAEEAKEEARKMFSVVTELSELKTVAEYQRQVVDNDKALKKLAEGVQNGYNVAAAQKLPSTAVRQVIDAIVKGFSDFIEALRINITKVKLFETLRRLPNRHGVRQERTLEEILKDAYVDSEATTPGADGRHRGRDELEK